MRNILALSLLAILAGCVPNDGPSYRISEAQLLFPDATERWGYFYGDPQNPVLSSGQDRNTLNLVKFEGSVSGIPWAVPGALWVNNSPVYRENSPAQRAVAKVTRSFPGQRYIIETTQALNSVWIYDTSRWYRLAASVAADRRVTVDLDTETPRFSNLSTEERDVALGEILARRGGRAVVVFELANVPLRRLSLEPSPWTYRSTALLVQYGVETELVISVPNPTPPAEVKVLQQGNSAYASRDASAVLSITPTTYNRLWEQISANQVPRPQAPSANFADFSYAAFFWGIKPSGGYGLRYVRSERVNNEWRITLATTSPAPGAITTQAITSPYIFLELPGRATRVTFFDESGRLLAQANAQ